MNKEDAHLPSNPHEFFSDLFCLSERKEFSYEDLKRQVPSLPRGWYELSRLPMQDRIEFTCAFWLNTLPIQGSFVEKIETKIEEFFENLEGIEIYVTQAKPFLPYETHMLYTLRDEMGFFQGAPPASPALLETLQKQFQTISFPEDYLAFQTIHNGFSKYTDTGLIPLQELARTYRKLQELLEEEELVRPDGGVIDPKELIPFYESYGLHSYQCFYGEWYPEGEMGTLFFSTFDYSVSNFLDENRLEANLAFPSFASWLGFYLEDLGL